MLLRRTTTAAVAQLAVELQPRVYVIVSQEQKIGYKQQIIDVDQFCCN